MVRALSGVIFTDQGALQSCRRTGGRVTEEDEEEQNRIWGFAQGAQRVPTGLRYWGYRYMNRSCTKSIRLKDMLGGVAIFVASCSRGRDGSWERKVFGHHSAYELTLELVQGERFRRIFFLEEDCKTISAE